MKNEMANTAAKKPLDEMAFSAMVAADEWLENHETNLDWSDTYALIHKMRKCIVEALPILRKHRRNTEMKYDDAIKLFENCPIACGMTCEALAERTCGYCALQRSAETILDALRMARDIESPKPLTLEQLKERQTLAKSIWIKTLAIVSQVQLSRCSVKGYVEYYHFGVDTTAYKTEKSYGKLWWAFDHEPKEEPK